MAAITTAAIGVASAGYQIYQGEKGKADAKRGLNNHVPQETPNNHANIGVSTYGSDLMREETGRLAASSIEAARGAGSRGIFSSLPAIQEATNKTNREIQIALDDQVTKRDYAIAGEEERIRAMLEQRDRDKLAGLGAMLNAGKHDTMSGIRGVANSLAYGLREIEADRNGGGSDDSSYQNFLKRQKEIEELEQASSNNKI